MRGFSRLLDYTMKNMETDIYWNWRVLKQCRNNLHAEMIVFHLRCHCPAGVEWIETPLAPDAL